MYVCNCNGIREREVRAAIFRRCQSGPRCAKCVCDMRRMIRESSQALRFASG